MSYNDWTGTRLARHALRRIVDGKPAFPNVARSARSFAARGAALEFLEMEGLIIPSALGPVATAEGRAEFGRKPRVDQYSKRDLEYLRAHYATRGAVAIAERIGRTPKGVQRLAERLGLANRETFKARARSAYTHYRGSPDV